MRRSSGPRACAALFAACAAASAACGLSVVGTMTVPDADASVASDSAVSVTDSEGVTVDATAVLPDVDAAAADAALDAGVLVRRWNIGGPVYAGSATLPGPWAAGEDGVGPCTGSAFSTASAIRNTTDDLLFQTELFGDPLTCAVAGLPPGIYRVRLLFAEIYFGTDCVGGGGTGSRVFDIRLEGATVLASFDLHATAGCPAGTAATAAPVIRSFDVQVTDGVLDIAMPASVNNAKLSALEVIGPRP